MEITGSFRGKKLDKHFLGGGDAYATRVGGQTIFVINNGMGTKDHTFIVAQYYRRTYRTLIYGLAFYDDTVHLTPARRLATSRWFDYGSRQIVTATWRLDLAHGRAQLLSVHPKISNVQPENR